MNVYLNFNCAISTQLLKEKKKTSFLLRSFDWFKVIDPTTTLNKSKTKNKITITRKKKKRTLRHLHSQHSHLQLKTII